MRDSDEKPARRDRGSCSYLASTTDTQHRSLVLVDQFDFICFKVMLELGSIISDQFPCYIVQLLGVCIASNVLLISV